MLLCISLHHRATAFHTLETASRHAAEVTESFRTWATGSALLATCNRFELYLETAENPASTTAELAATAIGRLARATGLPADELASAAEISTDSAVASHLFAVASGLESAALGEEEIAGQVRRAHDVARDEHSLSDGLERLFQAATRTSRRVRERTGIRSAGQSLVRLSLALAERRIPDWGAARVLLIGTGAYAGASVAALRDRGARHIRVHSPSGRAPEFAASHALDAVAAGQLSTALAEADLIVACSATQEPLLHATDLRPATPGSPTHRPGPVEGAPQTLAGHQPQLVLDLGMPRNVAAEVGTLPGVELLDLETIARHAPIPELSAEAEARELVAGAAAEFVTDQSEREIGPALAHLRGHVLAVLEDELCRARTAAGTPPTEELEAALRKFTGRLLHAPTTRLRALARAGRADEARAATHALFGEPEHTSSAVDARPREGTATRRP